MRRRNELALLPNRRCLSPNLLMNLMLCEMLLNKRSSRVPSSSHLARLQKFFGLIPSR
jgi:hypothetical protein